MFIRVKGRAVPLILLVVSSLWMAATVFPLFYSLLFPNTDIRHIVRAFEGKETLRADLAPLAEATNSVGRLKHAIQVAAYLGASAEYKHGESHTTKTTQLSYLAWFEKRSKPTILVVSRTETDSSRVHFDVNEEGPYDTLRFYLVPGAILAVSIYWFRRKRAEGDTAVQVPNNSPRNDTVQTEIKTIGEGPGNRVTAQVRTGTNVPVSRHARTYPRSMI